MIQMARSLYRPTNAWPTITTTNNNDIYKQHSLSKIVDRKCHNDEKSAVSHNLSYHNLGFEMRGTRRPNGLDPDHIFKPNVY